MMDSFAGDFQKLSFGCDVEMLYCSCFSKNIYPMCFYFLFIYYYTGFVIAIPINLGYLHVNMIETRKIWNYITTL